MAYVFILLRVECLLQSKYFSFSNVVQYLDLVKAGEYCLQGWELLKGDGWGYRLRIGWFTNKNNALMGVVFYT